MVTKACNDDNNDGDVYDPDSVELQLITHCELNDIVRDSCLPNYSAEFSGSILKEKVLSS